MANISDLPRRLAISIYIVAFAVAAAFHAADIIRWGWLPYDFAPFTLNLFWTTLLLLDPLVVGLLLFGWRRLGLALAVAIMIADVAANSYAFHGLGYREFAVALQIQTAFLGFVLGSVAFLWRTQEPRGSKGT